jgi:fatty-acyl-CoA synthase
VPARVMPIEAFPVTESANGIKIQRGKLRTMAEELLKE